jgi:SAM-dependent methyltransferase
MSTISAIDDRSTRLAELTARQQKMWGAGDYASIAALIHPVSERLTDDADLRAGWHVLDVATGTGNAVLAAARLGSYADGIDYVPELLERAAERAAAERLQIGLAQGDAQALPFDAGSYDAVISVFGVMFAADQSAAAAELLRVLRPGGTIALANWTPAGFVGELFSVTASHVPPPTDAPSPFVWGTEPGLRGLLAGGLSDLQLRTRRFTFRSRSPEHLVETFRTNYGPTLRAFEQAADPTAFQADLLDLVRRRNRLTPADGSVAIDAMYLEAIGTRC